MAGLHDQVVVLLGYIVAILVPCGTIYKMYTASLKNKRVNEADREKQDEIERRGIANAERLERIEKNFEKFQEKITIAVEKLADRLYENKK